jgi:DNA repair protein RAD50
MGVLPDSEHDLAKGMKQMFDPFEKVARSKHACPCCERGFNSEEEDDFVKKVDFCLYI